MLHFLRIFVMAAAAIVLCTAPSLAAKLTITGDVTYRERIALPPGATLSVGLVDLAKPDEQRIVAAAALANPGEVPLTFTLNFDEEIIVAGHTYGLVAEIIADNGAVWFRNAAPYAIDLPTPAEPIVIVVSFLGSDGTAPAPAPISSRHHAAARRDLGSRDHRRSAGHQWRKIQPLHRLRHASRRPRRLQLLVRAG